MSESLADILNRALNEIDEIGGNERHTLAQVIGRDAYDRMMSKQRTADLIDKWLSASPRSKAVATKTLSLAIAREADDPKLAQRVQRDLNDSFDVKTSRHVARPRGQAARPSADQVKKHAAAVNQKRNGQRVGYEKPKRVSVTMLAEIARNPDASKYIKARLNSRH